MEYSVSVAVGAKLSLDCSAKGLPEPNIQWFLNGTKINKNDRRIQLRNMRLYIDSVQLKDSGNFRCIVSNIHKEIERRFSVTIEGQSN